ncbi:hypothetical protein PIB30_118904 [Stylosanthes scabra]|uniref:Reverse transcriptase zinc-binding domain-containing protein n=1 Tax=Stylosanthes scabra TaxID=79078 RepID=A0ABU6QN34_9FABA|nr:hypothetical protein [Stylosanthes scabra]
MRIDQVDTLIWKHDNKCIFSVKSFVSVLYKNNNREVEPNMYAFAKNLWKGLVPPRVELLVWFVILGKMNTKDRLFEIGMIRDVDANCVLCDAEWESVYHLFFGCKASLAIWDEALNHWGVSWSSPGEMKGCFESWMGVQVRREQKVLWMIVFFSIIWEIWSQRNAIIFKCGKFDLKKIKCNVAARALQ